jgi:hypothetical protein
VNWPVAVKPERQVCKSLAPGTGQAVDAVPEQWAINIFINFNYVLLIILYFFLYILSNLFILIYLITLCK